MNKVNICAILSLVFSLLGLIVAGLPCGIAALVLGFIGLSKADTLGGAGFGITGTILGFVDVFVMIVGLSLLS